VLEVRLRAPRMRAANGEGDAGQDYGVRIEAINIHDLGEARNRFARAVRLTCNGESSGGKLRELLAPYRSGTCPVSVVYSNHAETSEIGLGSSWRVNLNDDLIRSLGEWLSPENVTILYQDPRAGQQ